jgi:outer membrane lipoprotein LolB
MTRRGSAGLALALTLLLSACANLTPLPALKTSDGDVRLTGRLSVQVAGGQGGTAQGGNALFDLAGSPAAGQLELSTPLGSLLARARWSANEVLLQTPNEERRFDTLDALTRELLGEAIPVTALFDWLHGRPWPQVASVPLADGAAGFSQLGWQIDLSQFNEGLVLAKRPTEPAVTLRARLER